MGLHVFSYSIENFHLFTWRKYIIIFLWYIQIVNIKTLVFWVCYEAKWGWLGKRHSNTVTVNLRTQRLWIDRKQWMQCECSEQQEDSCLGQDGKGGKRFHHTTQNGMQLKTYELPHSRTIHLVFLNRAFLLWVTETAEKYETTNEGELPQRKVTITCSGWPRKWPPVLMKTEPQGHSGWVWLRPVPGNRKVREKKSNTHP